MILLALLVTAAPAFAVITITGTPPQATVGSAYSFTFTASGGVAPYTFIANPGVPAGLTLSPSGVVSGTPTVPQQNSTVIIQATDSSTPNPQTGSIAVQFQIGAAPATTKLTIQPLTTLPPGNVGSDYAQNLSASGGVLPYTWKLASGSVPPGLMFPTSMTFSGMISGTPTTAGMFTFMAQVSDSATPQATAMAMITVTIANFAISTTSPLTPGVVGTPYSQTIAATGGTPPYTFSGGPPLGVGLTLSSTGTLSGTPTVAATITFNVQATDSTSLTTPPKTLSVTIAPSAGPTIVSTSLGDGVVGTPYSQTIVISGGSPPYNIAVVAGILPLGLMLSPSGVISGTPTAVISNNVFSIQVTDKAGLRATRDFVITITAPPLTITTTALPAASVGVPYSQTIAATGGVPPLAFFSSNIPTGFQLSTAGVLTGTPTATGSLMFTVAVFDSATPQAVVTKNFTLIVSTPLLISNTSPLPAVMAGTLYSQTFTATGGTPPYTFSIASGSAPNGLTLSATGTLAGTPNQAGTFNFSVQVKDSTGATASKAFSITVNPGPPVIITPAALPDGGVDLPYSLTLAASGGTGQFTFGLTSGSSLPGGLQLSSSGVLAGSPKPAGSYSFSITVTDFSTNLTATRQFTLKINPSPIIINTPTTLPSATAGVQYRVTFSASGGTGTGLSLTTTDTAPPGLAFDSQSLSGVPTTAGSYSFTLTFSDSGSTPVSRTFSLLVNPAGLAITNTSPLPGGTVGTAYNQAINATAGTPPYSFAVISGSLPNGLTLSIGGALTGTPILAGQSTFGIQVTDSTAVTATQTFMLSISAATLTITTTALSGAQVGTAYAQSIAVTGGTPPYTFIVASGTLPSGIVLSGAGTLSGAPTIPGNFGFTVAVTDSTNTVSARAFSIAVSSAGLMISTPSTLPVGVVGTPYLQSLAALGGVPPYTYAVASGTLPAGLTLTASGVLSGTPSITGTSNFTITVTDSQLKTASMAFSLNISNTSSLAISTMSPVPSGFLGMPYSQVISAMGGTAPYTFSMIAGILPGGLTVSAAGVLAGTPAAAGTFNFTVQATDSTGRAVTKAFSITIVGSIAIATATLANGSIGAPYSQTLSGTGGTPPYRFSLIGGNLPPGITLSASGAFSGTPTTGGTYNFTVQMIDSAAASATRALSITIGAGTVLSISTSSPLPNGNVGATYSQTFAATNGTPPYAWSVGGGSLPPGLTLSSAGVLNGTPTTAGTYAFTVQVADSAGATASQSISVTIGPATTVPSISAVVNGASYAFSAVSPGEIVTVFGSALGPSTLTNGRTTVPGFLDTSLAQTRVLFDGKPAPLVYVSDRQISAIVPYEISGAANTRIQVEYQGVQSPASTAIVSDTAPGVFSANASGRGPGAILNQDYSLNSDSNPAPIGSAIILYATGEGQTDPNGVNGKIAADILPKPKVPVTVTIDGVPAPVLYAGAAPGIVAGGLQINVLVPNGVSVDTPVPVIVTIGTKSSQAGVTMVVH